MESSKQIKPGESQVRRSHSRQTIQPDSSERRRASSPAVGNSSKSIRTSDEDEEDYHDVPSPSHFNIHLATEDAAYPFGIDLGLSSRQSFLAQQRLIDEVIQEQNQNQNFDQEILEELMRVNMQPAEDEVVQTRVANAIHHEGIPLTAQSEEAIAHLAVRKYSEPARLDRIVEHPPIEEGRAVNILPASRNLELPVNSLVAFGRRPSSSSSNLRNRRPANTADNLPLGWQASKNSLRERIEYMYCNEMMADVYFFVGKDEQRQRIPAHKFVLSVGSLVFDTMFHGGLTPQNTREPLEIELPDVEPSAFQTLLKFLYTDNVKIEPENVMTTLYTAKKYAVPAMEKACVDFLKERLGADNAFMLLTQARLFDEPQLERLCLELIDKNTHEALSGEGFTDVDVNTLCAVLARDGLHVRESLLFQSIIRWSKEECSRKGLEETPENQRKVLGKAIQLIRFPLMTIEEFAQTAAQSGLLTDREVVDVFLYFTANPRPSTSFNENPRCVMPGKELVICRFQRNEARWGYTGVSDRIKFTVDRSIYVVGFGLYGGIIGPHEYGVTIQILHCGTGKVIAENETSFVCDGSSSTFRVLFRDPVEITPSVTYIASAMLKGPDSHYGTKGLRRIVHHSAAGNVTFQFTYAAGNNNGTSVEDGQIPEIIFYTKV